MTQSGLADPLLVRAVQLCAENNVLIVAAAGNDGCQCLHLPAALPTVLAIGAMDDQGMPLDFSNWGDVYQNQGILAPGENILGAVPGGGTALKSGTSLATPIVSGIVALLLSLQHKNGVVPDPQAIRATIIASASPCNQQLSEDCRRFLAGSLNFSALQTTIFHGEEAIMLGLHSNEIHQAAETDTIDRHMTSSAPPISEQPMESASAAISSPNQSNSDNSAQNSIGISSSIMPSEACGCGGGGSMPLVYTLGELDFDFGTEARLDYFAQNISPANPTRAISKTDFIAYLSSNPWEAQSFNWVLKLDATPIYAIVPTGPFANITYDRLRAALGDENVERVSIPGYIAGNVRLMTGQVVPAIVPDVRGIYSWSTTALIETLTDVLPVADSPEQTKEKIEDYLNRIYYDFRNLGITPQERALNFSATNAFQIGIAISRGTAEDKVLDTVEVEKSPVCRPDSDCYDVKMIFFDPENDARSRTVFRFTIDVSDVIPVLIGSLRSWKMR
jgi:cyanobactin maturation PatA/PatG family protease